MSKAKKCLPVTRFAAQPRKGHAGDYPRSAHVPVQHAPTESQATRMQHNFAMTGLGKVDPVC